MKNELKVTWEMNTSKRLADNQFGYKSRHYQIQFKDKWLQSPTTKSFKNVSSEVQIRTMAQHLWATASHKLQYKIEQEVPLEMKRSINRVSALLETIDLEFDRVLHDKEEYIETLQHNADENISNFLTLPINVDTIEQYSKYKYPNLSTSKYWQNALLHDLNKNNLTFARYNIAQSITQ